MEIDFKHRLLMSVASAKLDEVLPGIVESGMVKKLYGGGGRYGSVFRVNTKEIFIAYRPGAEYWTSKNEPPVSDDPQGVYLIVNDPSEYRRIGTFFIQDPSNVDLIAHYLERWVR